MSRSATSPTETIEPGAEVRLEVAERESADGWQATTVRLTGKRHPEPGPS